MLEDPLPTAEARRRTPVPPTGDDATPEKLTTKVRAPDRPKIRCPLCRWQPRPEDRWSCTCWTAWNTFETRGRCPGCGKRWIKTQCLSCHGWSLHEDWYGEGETA